MYHKIQFPFVCIPPFLFSLCLCNVLSIVSSQFLTSTPDFGLILERRFKTFFRLHLPRFYLSLFIKSIQRFSSVHSYLEYLKVDLVISSSCDSSLSLHPSVSLSPSYSHAILRTILLILEYYLLARRMVRKLKSSK